MTVLTVATVAVVAVVPYYPPVDQLPLSQRSMQALLLKHVSQYHFPNHNSECTELFTTHEQKKIGLPARRGVTGIDTEAGTT